MASRSRSVAWVLGLLTALVVLAGFSPPPRGPILPSSASPSSGSAIAAGDTAVSDGLLAMGAPLWHLVGLKGQGARVGIVDVGFAGHVALLGGALPDQVEAHTFVDGEDDSCLDSGSAHGTAVAEIVHAVAPEAALYLAKVATPADLGEALAWLVGQVGVDVLHTSPLWYGLSPGDGTGELADLVADARAQGVVWVAPAGDARQRHWGGAWQDSDGDGLLEFGEQQESLWLIHDGQALLPPGLRIEAWMRWSDWAEADQDLDFCLVRYDSNDEIACGQAAQRGLGADTPTEHLSAETWGGPAAYGLYVRRHNGDRPLHIDIFVGGVTALSLQVADQSLAEIADAPGAIAVAAVEPRSPYTQAPYSSQGPTKGPGGVVEGGAPKPDLAAYARVNTLSLAPFEGTAAAAAHVAGAAALVRSAYPTYDADQVYALLTQSAIDLGAPGWDARYGYGRLYLGPPPVAPPVQRWLPVGRG